MCLPLLLLLLSPAASLAGKDKLRLLMLGVGVEMTTQELEDLTRRSAAGVAPQSVTMETFESLVRDAELASVCVAHHPRHACGAACVAGSHTRLDLVRASVRVRASVCAWRCSCVAEVPA